MTPSLLGRFGDRRLAATGEALLSATQQQQTMCLDALAGSRAQSAGSRVSSITRRSPAPGC